MWHPVGIFAHDQPNVKNTPKSSLIFSYQMPLVIKRKTNHPSTHFPNQTIIFSHISSAAHITSEMKPKSPSTPSSTIPNKSNKTKLIYNNQGILKLIYTIISCFTTKQRTLNHSSSTLFLTKNTIFITHLFYSHYLLHLEKLKKWSKKNTSCMPTSTILMNQKTLNVNNSFFREITQNQS